MLVIKEYAEICCRGNAGVYDGAIQLDVNSAETQMQSAKKLGAKIDLEKVFENDKLEVSDANPKVMVNRRNRSQLKVYIPQAERDSVSSTPSTRNINMYSLEIGFILLYVFN